MHALLPSILAGLVALPVAAAPAFGRTMEASDANVAQAATPAVVNIALWKLLTGI